MPTMCHFTTPVMKLLLIVLFIYHPFSHLPLYPAWKRQQKFYKKSSLVLLGFFLIIKSYKRLIQLRASETSVRDAILMDVETMKMMVWGINWFTLVHKFYQAIWTHFNKFCFIAWNAYPLAGNSGTISEKEERAIRVRYRMCRPD